MRRKIFLLLGLLLVPLIVSIALGQTGAQPTFAQIQTIGKVRPQGIIYDSNFDQVAMVDLQGQLVIADARDFSTKHVLYESGAYNAYEFSNDGRWLALALEIRIELWNTQTGELAASFQPEVLQVTGPLIFSDDDQILQFDSVTPAPAAVRRSENDTTIVPWLWHLPEARGEGGSTLPGQAFAYAFFNYRNGLVLGPNGIAIAGVPQRLVVLDTNNTEIPIIADIASPRNERDPISIWRSVNGDAMYARPINQNNLVQVNTLDGSLFDIQPGREYGFGSVSQLEGLHIGQHGRIIGDPVSLAENDFLRLLLGDDYRANWNYHPITVMLIDILEPLTPNAQQMGMLIYVFDETSGRGAIDFVSPLDVNQMVLHPDGQRLMVRRASGSQPLEVYNLNTGVLENAYFPVEPDPEGRRLLAYDRLGDTILVDFQRFDAATGDVLYHDQQITRGFDRFTFTDDSTGIVAFRGQEWMVWDIATNELRRTERILFPDELVDQWPDGHRYLMRSFTNDGSTIMKVLEFGMEDERSVVIDPLPRRDIERIIHSEDWEHFLVIYAATPASPQYPGNEIAMYGLDEGFMWLVGGDDLPPIENRIYDWVDNDTILIASQNPGSTSQYDRVYGVDYHASGLPNCLVETFPDDWTSFLDLWEQLNFRLRPDSLNRLSQRLCENPPEAADDFSDALTPTAPFNYRSDATVVPRSIPGVPTCLTNAYSSEAIEYAEAWRTMSAGLDAEARAELEDLLCEGLVGSLRGVQPTATPDELSQSPITATPPPEQLPENFPDATGAPRLVDAMTIDIHTQQRAVGEYLPPTIDRNRDYDIAFQIILERFEEQRGFVPVNPVISPDRRLLAAFDNNNFIRIYEIGAPYQALVADATAVVDEAVEEGPRRIALLPTATDPFDNAGQPRPTLTPTITPTSPPPADELLARERYDESEEICSANPLYDVSSPPADYAASGRIFMSPPDEGRYIWVLEPATGKFYPDDTLPICLLDGRCQSSFDGNWLLHLEEEIAVSRVDGTAYTVLFPPEEAPVFPNAVNWTGLNTLQYQYRGYLPDDITRSPLNIVRFYQPEAAELSAPQEDYANFEINELPTDIITEQPMNAPLAMVVTYFPTGIGTGQKYYMVNRETEEVIYFARLSNGSLELSWHPRGHLLFYRYPGQSEWMVYEVETGEHRVFGRIYDGLWSTDGRYRASWYTADNDLIRQRINADERFPKLRIWDSETDLIRQYCIPGYGFNIPNARLYWSPDNRYVLWQDFISPDGDKYPFRGTPGTPAPTSTPVPLEVQYQYQFKRTFVLDTVTGDVTVLGLIPSNPLVWAE